MSFSPADLNPEQREAVETIEGPLLLLAGAGTGKTRVITYRIAHLLASGISPEHILAVTFTNKAANEMRERVAALVPEKQAEALTIGTFHAFGMMLLRKHIHLLGYSRNFAIANEAFQVGYVRNIMAELGYETKKSESAHDNAIGSDRDCLAAVHRAKSALLTPDDLRASDDPLQHRIADVYEYYQTGLRNMNLVDFEDLLILVIRLWEKKPEVLEKHRDQFRHIMIDEYQDTNAVQFRMMTTLASRRGNICVVGDDDQSIYGWRGADITNILSFDQHFPGAKIIRLEQNYRSTHTILEAANSVIAHNRKRHTKKLWSNKGKGSPITTVRVQDEVEEARLLVELVKERKTDGRRSFGDFAVLYRSNYQSRAVEEALMRAKIPYTLVGGRSFFERKEVLDLIAILRAVCNPRDDLSLLQIINVPPRGVGQKAIERLRELQRITNIPLQKLMTDDAFITALTPPAPDGLRRLDQCLKQYRRLFAEGAQSMASLVEGVLRDSGYMDALGRMYKPRENALERRENLLEFVNSVGEYEARKRSQKSLGDLLDSLSLRDANDRREGTDLEGNSVTLMTVHAAKGLEFPVVFGIGMEHGLFPHQNAIADGSIEEERRLFYVAVTRAREELILSHAAKRRVRGASIKRRPSTFLHELPEELLNMCEGEDALRAATREEADAFMSQMLEMLS